MSRWFRLYDELLDDPKVQRLHPALFKVLVNLWCVASRNDGKLPSHSDLSFALRMSEDETFRAVSKLADAGFIDADSATGEQRPHGWDSRQYRSDVSTDRVRAHRERQKSAKKGKKHDNPPQNGGGSGNGDETFHGTPPDTDTETDVSVANATGAIAPKSAGDFCKAVFDSAIPLIVATGRTERDARSVIGRWRKTCGDADLLTLIRQSETEQHMDPLEWIMAAVETRYGTRKPVGVRQREQDPALALLRAAEAAEAEQDRAASGWPGDRGAWPEIPALGYH